VPSDIVSSTRCDEDSNAANWGCDDGSELTWKGKYNEPGESKVGKALVKAVVSEGQCRPCFEYNEPL
jgi:hypothetical protein